MFECEKLTTNSQITKKKKSKSECQQSQLSGQINLTDLSGFVYFFLL